MSNCNHFEYYYVYIHTIHTMSIDMVIENSELKLLLPPQEGVRDLPAQRGP